MERLGFSRTVCILFAFCAAAAIVSSAQTFTTLASFDDYAPEAPLVQGLDGNLYGTTELGGTSNDGMVFKITPTGTLTVLYSFCSQVNCADGKSPVAGLALASNGNFYGTTPAGGTSSNDSCVFGCGTVFEITPAGKLTTLYSFCSQPNCADGWFPETGMILAADGSFYGTTGNTVFRMTLAGKLTTVHTFTTGTGGDYPLAGLVQASSGNFYGTTSYGGNQACNLQGFIHGCGTIFEMTAAGQLSTLYEFDDQSTTGTYATLVQAANGNFYGTEDIGGTYQDGRVFEMSPAGTLTTLHSFDGADGYYPQSALVQASNGDFYGTTKGQGHDRAGQAGSVFEITPAGTVTTLYIFCSQRNCTDGDGPYGGVLQATNGTFYGTTAAGGAYGGGTVFSLAVGLDPFVETVTTSGEVGAKVIILGNNLTGATGVSFNGAAARFAVVSDTEITAAVPSGATTGRVSVTTTGGLLKSNVAFRVIE